MAHEVPRSGGGTEVMDLRPLEATLESLRLAGRPTPRGIRDALVDYYATVARPYILKGLRHTQPDADDALVHRLLLLRIGTLWNDLPSTWESPTIEDLRTFRRRIDEYACVPDDPRFAKVRRLLDEVMLTAAVTARLELARARQPVRRFSLIRGGGVRTAPRGRLRLVSNASRPVPPGSTASR
jgi:hypothetical protein